MIDLSTHTHAHLFVSHTLSQQNISLRFFISCRFARRKAFSIWNCVKFKHLNRLSKTVNLSFFACSTIIVEILLRSSAKSRCLRTKKAIRVLRTLFKSVLFVAGIIKSMFDNYEMVLCHFFASKFHELKFHTTNNGFIPQHRHRATFCIKNFKIILQITPLCKRSLCTNRSSVLDETEEINYQNVKQMSETKVSIELAIVWSSDSTSSSLSYYCFQFHAKHTHIPMEWNSPNGSRSIFILNYGLHFFSSLVEKIFIQ